MGIKELGEEKNRVTFQGQKIFSKLKESEKRKLCQKCLSLLPKDEIAICDSCKELEKDGTE